MKLEEVDGAVRELGDHLFSVAEELTGERPQFRRSKGVYKVKLKGKVVIYLHFLGDRARGHRRNAVILNTKWNDELTGDHVKRGNGWWGRPAAELTACPENRKDAEKFIKDAIRIHTSAYAKS